MNVKQLTSFQWPKDTFEPSPSISKMIKAASIADWPLDDDFIIETTGLIEQLVDAGLIEHLVDDILGAEGQEKKNDGPVVSTPAHEANPTTVWNPFADMSVNERMMCFKDT